MGWRMSHRRADAVLLIGLATLTAAAFAFVVWMAQPAPAFVWPVDLCPDPEGHFNSCTYYDRRREA